MEISWEYHQQYGDIYGCAGLPFIMSSFFYWLVDVNSQLDQLDLEIHIYNYITKCPIFFCMDCLA